MKHIKIFENFELDVDKVCSIYEDLRSIGYILEEEGISAEYRLRFVCVPEGTLQKEIRSMKINSIGDIKSILARPKTSLRELFVCIEHSSGTEEQFKIDFNMYYSFLREHLDYVDGSFISVKGWRPPLRYEVSISADFFKRR